MNHTLLWLLIVSNIYTANLLFLFVYLILLGEYMAQNCCFKLIKKREEYSFKKLMW